MDHDAMSQEEILIGKFYQVKFVIIIESIHGVK